MIFRNLGGFAMKTFKRFLIFGILVLAALSLSVACGDDDDDDDAGPGDDFGDENLEGFILCTGGAFSMGSPSGETGQGDDENEHEVTLTHNYLIMDTEVTQADFQDVLKHNPSEAASCGADCPVENVSWYDAIAYTIVLSETDDLPPCYELSSVLCWDGIYDDENEETRFCAGQGGIFTAEAALKGISSVYECEGYRLPTEAEWEYAARAGQTTALFNGDLTKPDNCNDPDPNLDLVGWYCGNSSAKAHSGALLQKNGWNIYDMHGNVSEWTWDEYSSYSSGDTEDPESTVGDGETNKVHRGGNFAGHAKACRSAARGSDLPSTRYAYIGFRLVKTYQ
jgi:formylglycine-generating enzyme required for sulfatase activity